MRVDRANTATPPRQAWAAPLRWVTSLTKRVPRLDPLRLEARDETDPEMADLWLMLLAGDPEGTWHVWPRGVRRPQLDDTRRT
jgi:hypothetical protein